MPTTDALDSKSSTAHPRYDEYEESGADWLGEIPAHWERIRLKFLADFTGGGTPSKDNQEYWDGSIPWVSPKDMKAGRVTETQDYITPEAVVESSTKLVDPGSVLIVVRSGILKHTIPVATNEVEVALNQDLKAITPDDSLRSRYLAYLIEGRNDTLLLKWTKSGTTVESLEQRRISNTEIPVPPPEEQHAITTYLDRETERIDALIEKKKQLIDLLEEKRKALISRVVTKGLDDNVEMQNSGVEWLGEIPVGWETAKLRHLCKDIFLGLTSSVDYVDDGGYPLVRAVDIAGGELDLSGTSNISEEQHKEITKYRQARQNDVLLSKSGSIGTVALVDTDREFSIYESIFVLRPRREVMFPRHLLYVMRSETSKAQYEQNLTGMGVSHLNMSDFVDIKIPVPPISEQRKIYSYLEKETKRIGVLTNKIGKAIDQLKEYRTAIISAAVTGQIDVRETTGRPAGHEIS